MKKEKTNINYSFLLKSYDEIIEFNKNENYYNEFESESTDENNTDRDYFDAMSDGQLGDYDDFNERGGSMDDVNTWSGR